MASTQWFVSFLRDHGVPFSVPELVVAAGVAVLGLLMVSAIPYRSFKELDLRHGFSTLVLVVGRRTRMFSKAEISRLRQVESIVHAAMQNIWQRWSATPASGGRDAGLHRRLTRCFENFGEGLLTDREREITQLLLRGHSTKSIARALRIAPGTVMVHKRNLFAKLGITSQFELFSRFIDAL